MRIQHLHTLCPILIAAFVSWALPSMDAKAEPIKGRIVLSR